MSKSKIFSSDTHKTLETKIKDFLNSYPSFMTEQTSSSPRATGDAIQEILGDSLKDILGGNCSNYSSSFERRAMADLSFSDADGFNYIVDVKTHRLSTSFSMPNLISVERLAKFYEDDKNYFILLIVQYKIVQTSITVEQVHFLPIESLDWNCLTIGALGWGQIQIKNANTININATYSRKKWMKELCETLLKFYPKEVEKIKKRIDFFKVIKNKWEQKVDE